MRCLLEGWKVGRCVIVGMFLSNIPTIQLSAQVGHNPGTSPYHDFALHAGPMFFVGHLGADRGKVQAGTSNALTFGARWEIRSEEHTSELQSRGHLVCRLLLEKKNIEAHPDALLSRANAQHSVPSRM